MVKHPALDFGSGRDLTVGESEPHVRLAAVSAELTWDPLSPSLFTPPPLALSLSVSKIGTHSFFKGIHNPSGGEEEHVWEIQQSATHLLMASCRRRGEAEGKDVNPGEAKELGCGMQIHSFTYSSIYLAFRMCPSQSCWYQMHQTRYRFHSRASFLRGRTDAELVIRARGAQGARNGD